MARRAKSYYVKTLRRRVEFLEDKVGAKDASPAALSYLQHELAALRWAIPILSAIIGTAKQEHARMIGQGEEYNGSGTEIRTIGQDR